MESSAKWPTLRSYVACYALYIGLIIPGTVVVLMIWRSAILAMLAAFMARSQANRLIYLASMAVLGLCGFILVMAAEPYLRSGIQRRKLMLRFRKLAIPLVIAGALGLLVLTFV